VPALALAFSANSKADHRHAQASFLVQSSLALALACDKELGLKDSCSLQSICKGQLEQAFMFLNSLAFIFDRKHRDFFSV
jgi:hypothetical protein